MVLFIFYLALNVSTINREVSATTNDVNYERIEGGFQDFSSLCFDQSYVQRAIEDVYNSATLCTECVD